MSLTQTQIKGTIVLNSDAGANITVGNSTATNAITGTTNINTSGTANTSIGNAGFGNVSLKGQTVDITQSNAVNIQSSSAGDNAKTLTLGNTNGSFTTLTTVNGRLTTLGVANINATGGLNSTIGTIDSGIVAIRGATLNIGNTTSNIALGALTGAGATTLNKPLTPAYAYPVAIGTIGQIVAGTLTPPNGQAYADNVVKVLTTFTLTPGIWLVSGSSIVNIPAGCLATQMETWIENNSNSNVFSFSGILNQQNSTLINNFVAFPISVAIFVSATATFSQKVKMRFTATAPTVNDYQFKTQGVRFA